MTTERTSEREVPEDKDRKQILVYEDIRSYLRTRSDAESRTYSEQIKQWIPDDWEGTVHEFDEGDIVNIKVTPEVHGQVGSMAGSRVKPGDVLAFYAMLDALDNGDIEVAADFAEYIPRVLWDALAIAGDGDGD